MSTSPTLERWASNGTGVRRKPSHRKGAASLAASTNQDGSLQTIIADTARRLSSVEGDQGLVVSAELENPGSSSVAFLASLTTQTLTSLQSQPELLASSSSKLDEQLFSLCQRQVQPLVQVHQSTSALGPTLAEISTSLETLLQSTLPGLAESTASFETSTSDPVRARLRAQKLIEANAATLPDLMDIPELVATCVRNSYHTQAIELAAHIDKLARPDSQLGGGKLLSSLRRQAWGHLQGMRVQLLQSFESRDLRLFAARRHVEGLRQLRQLDEMEGRPDFPKATKRLGLTDGQICLAFLRARTNMLKAVLSSPLEALRSQGRDIATASSSQNVITAQLAAYIEVWRRGVADTCSIALEIFVDLPNLPRMLSAFIHRHYELLCRNVREKVDKMITHARSRSHANSSAREATSVAEEIASTLLSLHSQLSFAVASLADLGADVTPLLAGSSGASDLAAAESLPFHSAILEALQIPCTRAVDVLKDSIDASTMRPPSSWLCKREAISALLAEGASSSLATDLESASSFPTLAHFCNNVLIGLNSMRTFAPISVRNVALSNLDARITEAVKVLYQHFSRCLNEERGGGKAARNRDISKLLPPLATGEDGDEELDAIASSSHRSLEAERFIAAAGLDRLLRVVGPYLRASLWTDVFGSDSALPDFVQEGEAEMASSWVQEQLQAWQDGERHRSMQIEDVEARRAQEAAQIAAEAQAKAEEEAKAKAQAEEEERRRAEAEAKAREEEETRAKAEQEARAQAEAKRREEQAQAEAEAETRRRVEEERAEAERREREARARAEAEAEAKRLEDEAKAKAAAEAEAESEQVDETSPQAEQQVSRAPPEPSHGASDTQTRETQAQGAVETRDEVHQATGSASPPTASSSASDPSLANSVSAAPSTIRKPTLAEKLKLRQEERSRQQAEAEAARKAEAELASRAAASADASAETDPSRANVAEEETAADPPVPVSEPGDVARLSSEHEAGPTAVVDDPAPHSSASVPDDSGEADAEVGHEVQAATSGSGPSSGNNSDDGGEEDVGDGDGDGGADVAEGSSRQANTASGAGSSPKAAKKKRKKKASKAKK